MKPAYTISEAAQRAEATVHQVRTYLSAGLVKPCAKTAGGSFVFNEGCVARLRLIAAATRAGLRIREIEDLIRALGVSDPQALRSARRSVTAAIDSRQAAIQRLEKLVSGACDAAVTEVSP